MWNRITRSVSANVILAVVAAVCLVSALSLVRSASQVQKGFAAARARIADLTAQKERLEEAISELTQEEAVWYRAKARLNLKNPGEEIVVVLPDKPEVSAPARSGVWQRIKDFLRALTARRPFVQ